MKITIIFKLSLSYRIFYRSSEFAVPTDSAEPHLGNTATDASKPRPIRDTCFGGGGCVQLLSCSHYSLLSSFFLFRSFLHRFIRPSSISSCLPSLHFPQSAPEPPTQQNKNLVNGLLRYEHNENTCVTNGERLR
jgi:hypothetical protein